LIDTRAAYASGGAPGQSSDEENPYESYNHKHKALSALSEESEVVMFRADESSICEDKNLPTSYFFSPSKFSKCGNAQHKIVL
jgi:hypothetical protein